MCKSEKPRMHAATRTSLLGTMAGVAEHLPDIDVGFCVPQPVHTTLRGLETVATYNHANMDVLLALFLTGTVLFWFAWYVRFSQRAKGIKGCSLLRIQVFYYCISVGIFGIVRGVFDTGRFLLACAAFHNLAEWGYFGHRWLKRETVPKFFRGACLYIWLLITTVVALLPSMKAAVILEQTLGIMCDYYLVISYFTAYIQHYNNEALRPMWGSAWIASMLHFFQIYPLVAGTVLGPCHPASKVVEWLLTSGSIPCFYFYTNFALRWDENEYGTTFQPIPAPTHDTSHKLTNGYLALKEKVSEAPRSSPYSKTNHWGTMVTLMAIGMFCGLVTVLGPGLLPRCPNPTIYPCPVGATAGHAAAAAAGHAGAVHHPW
ncbi:hypothetical protein WJX72_000418 [[Myrmecia] bisecta]|uniref:Uncharacterized protein n=1 Tax=[Myrmecia] bisecta TaxID=41462 RepID=A0AAW1QNX1_9CHLO